MRSIRTGRSSASRWLNCIVLALLITPMFEVVGNEPAKRADKIKIVDAHDHTAMSMKLKDNGAKIVDGSEQELARITRSGNKIKVKDADDKPLGFIVVADDRIRLESADEKTVICTLHRQKDGDWKFENERQQHVCTMKRRDYGVEIEGLLKKSLYKVKLKSGKCSLRNADDLAVYTTHDSIAPAAMGCLGLDGVPDLRLRAAMMFAMEHGSTK